MHEGRIVEQGPAEQIYVRPQSEYTRALLTAVPVPDPERMQARKAERRSLRLGASAA
jgi:peptide/nickel transport system ATP-binding protein